jgi:hypothetical protein
VIRLSCEWGPSAIPLSGFDGPEFSQRTKSVNQERFFLRRKPAIARRSERVFARRTETTISLAIMNQPVEFMNLMAVLQHLIS